jgi:hypothetical protein
MEWTGSLAVPFSGPRRAWENTPTRGSIDEIFTVLRRTILHETEGICLAAALMFPAKAALSETPTRSDAPVIEASSLTEDQLREAITGKTIYLKVSGFELPIHYKGNGRMTGSMGAVAATFSRGDGSRDSGRWWTEANQLCQRWTVWMEGRTNCYKITRKGSLINWVRQDGVSGTARIED